MAVIRAALPDKLYYRIGEVADIVGVKPYVLRYWEGEFGIPKPLKSRSKQRLYRRRDVHVLLQIKHLLHEERFTIDGARMRLKASKRGNAQTDVPPVDRAYRSILAHLKRELEALRQMLS